MASRKFEHLVGGASKSPCKSSVPLALLFAAALRRSELAGLTQLMCLRDHLLLTFLHIGER